MTSTDGLSKRISKSETLDFIPFQADIYGERYTRYRRYFAICGLQAHVPEFPIYIHFEQTFSCNLRCPICLQGYQNEKEKYNTGVPILGLDLYEKLIKECTRWGCPSIAMQNCDEPLLVKDIAHRIGFAKANGVMDIFMTTNGQLLTREMAIEICEAGLTHILFSIDAADPLTYSKIRVNGNYGRVIDALSCVMEWKKESNSSLPIIRASFVLNLLNSAEEEQFIRRFKDSVDYIDIQSFYSIDSLNRHLVPKKFRPVDPKTFVCAEPFRTITIRSNGDVSPCCSVFGYKQIVGNVYNNTIHEIFNNKKMRTLRKQLRNRSFNEYCRNCVTNLYEINFGSYQ